MQAGMRLMAGMLGAALLCAGLPTLTTLALAEDALSTEQKQAIETLRQRMWDEGYADEEIEAAIEEKKDEFLGRKKPAAESPRDEESALFRRYVDDLSERGILPEEARQGIKGGMEEAGKAPADRRSMMLEEMMRRLKQEFPPMWRGALVRERLQKGMPPQKAEKDADRFLSDKRNDMGKAWKALDGQKLEGEARLDRMRRKFPEVPEICFSLLEDITAELDEKEVDEALKEEDGFTREEIEEIVDELMRQMEAGMPGE